MKISNFEIGKNRTFIIAELSANHNQDFDLAVKTIRAMKEAGADAVKLQTYTADTMTIDCNNEYFRIEEGLWKGENLYSLYQRAYTPWEWQPKLKKLAEDLGLVFFSTPFDKTAVDFLEEMNVPIYKVASFEIRDIPLIKYIASKGKPIIISTGIATLSDIEDAVNACREMGNDQITLLKCTSAYPAPIEDANLRNIPNLKETFGVKVGLSDHTIGSSVPIASVALGARVIEKHFILDKSIDSPDVAFSMEPNEFKQMVKSIREVEKALGTVNYSLSEKVKKSPKLGRSLFVVKEIKKGEEFTEENVRSIRPGYGLHPRHIDDIIGHKSSTEIKKGTPLNWNLIDFND